ncbi:MAG: response regulator transcription factor [Deltaproteobacteria bacterium]|nr:response regulator transcription factor [Deltaproteobacteria bacterium]
MIRVLIADDHAIVRQGLKQIVAETSDIVVTGEAENCDEAEELIRENDYDAVVLDISMPGKGGLETLKQVKAFKRDVPILVLSIHPEEVFALRAFRSGASGYLTKQSAPEELIGAIRKISSGAKYITPVFAERLASYVANDVHKPLHASLSDREYQIMSMLAAGNSVRDIGAELNLSIKTVSTYRYRLMRKLHLKTNVELTHYALNNNLHLEREMHSRNKHVN